jgi:queuine/archaeosine tRNA-ribosyltransferase
MGFGSFGTSGGTNSINTVTNQSLDILRSLVELSRKLGFNTHLFGVSTPPILYLFQKLGISTFDSMAWMKAAGYGNVFPTLMRGHLVTYRAPERTHTFQDQFEYLKSLTGHQCEFCADFSQLMNNRMARIMHNLTCIVDTLAILNSCTMSREQILQIIALASPRYLQYYKQ